MNIYYDYQILYNQRYGGISRYYYELINMIEEKHLANTDISCMFSTNHYFAGYRGIDEGSAFLNIRSAVIRRPLRFMGHMLNQEITKKKAKKADVIHLTYYNPYALNITDVKKVVTVYDMIEEINRKDETLDRIIVQKRECIRKADHVIAISESTKNDILRIYPEINEDKISVIYIGTSMNGKIESKIIKDEVRKKFPDRYILYVGQRGGYKNFNTFIKPIMEVDKELYLMCIGGGDFTSDELRELMGIEKRVIQMNADDDVLAKAYCNALAFVFPSMYEGFGIPTLEAFTCNCPAIISNTSSMPEVGGDAVLYFNPEDVEEMRDRIYSVLNDSNLRSSMIEKGRERLNYFSWESIANQTIQCYKSLLMNNGGRTDAI